jgi:hypothetical protein
MDQQQIENTIQFLVENQARFQTDLDSLRESVHELTDSQKRTDAQIAALTEEMRGGFANLIQEMREGFENLIVANEVTRDLASRIGELSIITSQRVAQLEGQGGEHSH